MNCTTGSLFCSAVIEAAKAGLAGFGSAGSLFMRSLRSLFGPGRKSTRDRELTVGTASDRSGRSAEKKGASFGATGLDVLTSVVRSTSVARRFTNVVLALRSVGGSSRRSVSKAVFCDAIAPAVALALPTREARSSRRAAIAVTSWDELARKLVNAPWSRSSCWITWSVLDREGAKYLALRLACGPLP